MRTVRFPTLYEIATRDWLRREAEANANGRPATLDDVGDRTLDRIAGLGFDWVWLLGIWRTGSEGRSVSLGHPEWTAEYRAILADFDERDVCGSPFAVQGYDVHDDFGGEPALLRLRERLRDRGIRLMLDFVPNHTARDHPWVVAHPDYYIRGTADDLARSPENYGKAGPIGGEAVLAFGRDPYFPGWPDTFQLNYRHPALREAMRAELLRVAGLCDGVRCDMAMLVLPDIFKATWGDAALPADGTPPDDSPFWPEAIARVRASVPGFLFLAEAYWDREWSLQQEGFDFTYDKRLCDRLRLGDAGPVRAHLRATPEYQRKSARFLENHDEPRAAHVFPPAVHPAAATLTYLVPGLRFFHDGQLEGHKVRGSVHLARRPVEPADPDLSRAYAQLLEVLCRRELQGHFQLLECRAAWEGNPTWRQWIAFSWRGPEGRLLVAVNYGPDRAQALISLDRDEVAGRDWVVRDLVDNATYSREGDDLAEDGLYVELPAWGRHIFTWSESSTGD